MDISVNSLIRNQFIQCFGPEKPKKPEQSAGHDTWAAYRAKKDEYLCKVEVFVYNTTANVANGAVAIAIVAAVAAVFSALGPLFALFIIGTSAAIHWDAKQTLPLIEARTFHPPTYGSGHYNALATVYRDFKGEESEVNPIADQFGLNDALFIDEDGKAWQQVALTIAGFGLWLNALPTGDNPQQNAESVDWTDSTEESEGETDVTDSESVEESQKPILQIVSV